MDLKWRLRRSVAPQHGRKEREWGRGILENFSLRVSNDLPLQFEFVW